ncbi:alpha/beta hydrolase [Methylobrevis pamukkalensis]|uniref:Alpha/beta hydrolase family protein n=1 Tax=Methylobrevis pamukkalensis TaxID=1439726 RepID=A0A1E3H830_9HYPH|nr:alpha/beta hydrolase [Methylobrevis pamukkalensis]ODN72487.1 hypothetical protein A6302_00233 [Methylobrevis pamukkalensis]
MSLSSSGPALPESAVRIIYDRGLSVMRYAASRTGDRDTLFVTFTGFEGNRNDRPGFGEIFLGREGVSCLAVKCVNRNNFSDISLEEMREATRDLRGAYRRVVTYGQSGGGFAALYFASALSADAVIAISPRNSRDPKYRHKRTVIPDEWQDTQRPLREVDDGTPQKLVIYDCFEPQDRQFFDNEIAGLAGLRTIVVPNAGHPVTQYLSEIDVLKLIVRQMRRADDPDLVVADLRATIHRTHRQKRRANLHYLTILARRAAMRKKAAAFDGIVALLDGRRGNDAHVRRIAGGYRALHRPAAFRAEVADGLTRFPQSERLRELAAEIAARRGERPAPGTGDRTGERAGVGPDRQVPGNGKRGLIKALRGLFEAGPPGKEEQT